MSTKIIHVSIAAKDPERAAKLLAELTGGAASRFRAKGLAEGAWVCLWNAKTNELVEFIPLGFTIVPGTAGAMGTAEAEFAKTAQPLGYNATHIQLRVDTPLATIKEISNRHACQHYFRPASGGPLYEVWIEDQLLVELVSGEIEGCEGL